MLPFEVARSIPGYVKLDDGTELVVRVVIGMIDELERTPVGLSLGVGHQVIISASSPPSLKEKVKDKPYPAQREHLKRLDIWYEVKILKVKKALEEVIYTGSDGRKYKVLIEIEPTIVSRTLEYKDGRGNPIYHVRWGTRTTITLVK